MDEGSKIRKSAQKRAPKDVDLGFKGIMYKNVGHILAPWRLLWDDFELMWMSLVRLFGKKIDKHILFCDFNTPLQRNHHF